MPTGALPSARMGTEHAPAPDRPRAQRSRWALRRLGIAAGVVAIGGAVVRFAGCGEALFYFPSREPFGTPSRYQDVTFTTPDGLTLHGWFIPARVPSDADPAAPRPAVLHAHGNAGNVSVHDAFSRFIADAGIHVLLFDYRGYGRSARTTALRRDALLEDTLTALDYLRSRPDVDADRIGAYGVSLGGAFALAAAAARPEDIAAVCTVAAFSGWARVAGDVAPIISRLLIADGLDPEASAQRLGSMPYLVVHGTGDRIVRPYHGDRLAAAAHAAGVPVATYTAPGASHNTIFDDDPGAQRAVADFFVEHLRPDEAPPP